MPRQKRPTKPNGATLGFEAKLWQAADKLRSNMDAAEYKHVVLGLIFLKYISDAFAEHHAWLEHETADPHSEAYVKEAQGRYVVMEDRDEYRAANIFWVPKEARWSYLQAIGRLIDDAMVAIARATPESWFVDVESARVKATGHDLDLRSDLIALFLDFFQDFALRDIPQRWDTGTPENFADPNPERWSSSTGPPVVEYVDLAMPMWERIESNVTRARNHAQSRARCVFRPVDTTAAIVRPGNGSYKRLRQRGLTGGTWFALLRPRRRDCAQHVHPAATSTDSTQRVAHRAVVVHSQPFDLKSFHGHGFLGPLISSPVSSRQAHDLSWRWSRPTMGNVSR